MKKLLIFLVALAILWTVNGVYAQKLPDLDLANISCLHGKLFFTVINRGDGPLPIGWRAVADVYFDGAKKGHIDLGRPTSTTGDGIDKPGGKSSYLTAFSIMASVKVDIFIDATDAIKESNEENNFRRGAHLKPCDEVTLPDLVVEDIALDNKCNVVVRVKNNGPGSVQDEVWTIHKPESSGAYLYIDGRKWGGEAIWKFDPSRSLQSSGGTATYKSKLNVSGTATITVLIDHTNQVTESNEDNNKKAEILTCEGIIKPSRPKGVAFWKITTIATEPKCYKTPAPGGPDFLYTITVEFKASPSSLPPGGLVIEAKYESNIETVVKPHLNLTDATKTWGLGTSGTILWDGDKIGVVKVNSRNFIIKKTDCHIGPKVKGDTKTIIKTYTAEPTGMRLADTKTLIFGPCKS